jgi:hypothetical protein
MRRPKWVERVLFGSPQACVAGRSEAFRTVSLGTRVNKGKKQGRVDPTMSELRNLVS